VTTEAAERIRPATILDLHKLGFKVVPLAADGKTPSMQWTAIYEENWKIDDLAGHYDKFNNIATCLGKTYVKDQEGRDLYLNCLDVDSKEVYGILFNMIDGQHSYSLVQKLMEQTVVVKTRKPAGYHAYWLSHEQNPPVKSERCKTGFEFEIKTDKSSGLCTLPPSRHRDDPNFHYNNFGQNKLLISDSLYEGLLDILKDCLKPQQSSSGKIRFYQNDDSVLIDLSGSEITDIVNELKPLYKHGHRHSLCLYLAGHLHKNGISSASAKAIFEALTTDDEEKKQRIATLEETYKKARHQVTGYRALFDVLTALDKEKSAKQVINRIYALIIKHKNPDEKDAPDYAFELSETLKKEYTFKTMNDTREVYYYDTGRYVENGERRIEVECAILIPDIKTAIVKETIEMIRRTTPADRKEFDSNIEWLSLQNGLINLRTGEFMPHDPTLLTLVQLPIMYNPDADFSKYKISQFLNEILPDESDRNSVIDYFTYCLWRDYPIHKALMMVGSGRNGKTTLSNMLIALLGQENVSAVSLRDLDTHRFMVAELYGKLANIGPDLKSKLLEDTGNFKALTGNDHTIQVEKKGRDPFKLRNFAKFIYVTNRIPDTLDDTDAFFARWIIINFRLQFLDNANTHLLEELTTPEELSAFFNMLRANIPNILKNGIRQSDKTIAETYDKYMASADPIRLFIERLLRSDPGTHTRKAEVYEAYKKFAEKLGLGIESEETLGRRLKKHGYRDAQKREEQDKTKRYQVWKDLKLLDLASAEEGQETLD
jgi:P4 family phage/plasmid primase-like protien